MYIISGSEDTYVDLVILTFNLDTVDPYGGSLVTCRGLGTYDYVELRDGASETSPLIAKLCGKDKPKLLHSTQNKMWIRCHFGEQIQRKYIKSHSDFAGSNQGSRTLLIQEQGLRLLTM